jgi:hypothetical protein
MIIGAHRLDDPADGGLGVWTLSIAAVVEIQQDEVALLLFIRPDPRGV